MTLKLRTESKIPKRKLQRQVFTNRHACMLAYSKRPYTCSKALSELQEYMTWNNLRCEITLIRRVCRGS
jgi:hypothetical protein